MALPGFVRGQGVGERDERGLERRRQDWRLDTAGEREGGRRQESGLGARAGAALRGFLQRASSGTAYEDGCRCRSWPMSGGQANEELQAEGVWLSERTERCVCACG